MQRRDWAGTVLLSVLAILAGVFHAHRYVPEVLGGVCVICLCVITYDIGHDRGRKRHDLELTSDASQPTVVLTVHYTGHWATYHPPDRSDVSAPRLNVYGRLYAALPADADPVTLLGAELDASVDGVAYSENGLVAQHHDRVGEFPDGFRFPPVVTPGTALDIDCVFLVFLPWNSRDSDDPPRPKRMSGTVTVADHLQRRVSVEVDFGLIL